MTLSESQKLPNDKQATLDAKNYEVFNRDLVRKVFPRIIADFKRDYPKAKVGDIIPFYMALLANVDGVETNGAGDVKDRFGACFLSQEAISEMTGISKRRMAFLTEVLLENGLLAKVERRWINMRQQIWYYPSWCPRISEDGYVVSTDGERIIPDMDALIEAYERTVKRCKP